VEVIRDSYDVVESTTHYTHYEASSELGSTEKFFFFMKKPKGLVIQHLQLSKTRFKTKADAVAWCRKNGFRTDRFKEKENYYHFTQRDKRLFRSETFVTVKITRGVQAVMGRLKKKKMVSLF